MLLVHGLASNCRTWEAVGARLHRLGHPVAAVDLRGHGRSDKPDDGYDFATMGDDLLAAIDALGFEPAGGGRPVDRRQHRPRPGRRVPDRVAAVVGVDGGTIELQHQWPEWDDCARALAPPPLAGHARGRHRRPAPPRPPDVGRRRHRGHPRQLRGPRRRHRPPVAHVRPPPADPAGPVGAPAVGGPPRRQVPVHLLLVDDERRTGRGQAGRGGAGRGPRRAGEVVPGRRPRRARPAARRGGRRHARGRGSGDARRRRVPSAVDGSAPHPGDHGFGRDQPRP